MEGGEGPVAPRRLTPEMVEYPAEATLRAMGDATFLAMRSEHHRAMRVANLRAALEPPLVLGQYRLFRFDGVPRAMITWAWLTPAAELSYVAGGDLGPDDWAGGRSLWLIDLIAPYPRLAAGITRWVMTPGNFTDRGFTFRRVKEGARTRRVVRINLETPENKADVMTEAAFLRRYG